MKYLLIGLALLAVSGTATSQVFTPSKEVRSVETLTASQRTFVRSLGGGWGHPEQRNKDAIENDILNGFISDTDAKKIYKYSV